MNARHTIKSLIKIVFLILLNVQFYKAKAQKTAAEYKDLGIKNYKEKEYTKAIEAFTKTIELMH